MHSMFGTKHLLILVAALIIMILGVLAVRKWPLEKLAKRLLAVGVVSEFIKVFYYTIANEATHGGILPKTDLPFLTEKYGWAVYVAHYISLIIFCVTLCYITPIAKAIRSRFKKQEKRR